jgi:curved DNA-binding protein CbpA
MLGVDKHADAAAIRSAYKRLVRSAHPDKGGDPEDFVQLTKAYEVLGDDRLRADYQQALAEQAGDVPVEFFTDSQGREWVSLSALHLEETTNRQQLLQLQEDHRKLLQEDSAAVDDQLKKKDELFQKKEQELDRVLQELQTLASRKMLDDLRVQYEGIEAERAATLQRVAAELALASQQEAAALAAQQINELKAALKTQHSEHLNRVAALDLALKTRDSEHVKQLAQEAEYVKQLAAYMEQVASRDLALKIHEAQYRKQLAAKDKELTIQQAEYLQKLARQDDQFISLMTQLEDLQRTPQHQDPVSRFQLLLPPPPPLRCSINELNFPPPPVCSIPAHEHEREQP